MVTQELKDETQCPTVLGGSGFIRIIFTGSSSLRYIRRPKESVRVETEGTGWGRGVVLHTRQSHQPLILIGNLFHN